LNGSKRAAACRAAGKQKDTLLASLEQRILPLFVGRLLSFDTADRMERQHDADVNAALLGMTARLGIMNDRLGRIRV